MYRLRECSELQYANIHYANMHTLCKVCERHHRWSTGVLNTINLHIHKQCEKHPELNFERRSALHANYLCGSHTGWNRCKIKKNYFVMQTMCNVKQCGMQNNVECPHNDFTKAFKHCPCNGVTQTFKHCPDNCFTETFKHCPFNGFTKKHSKTVPSILLQKQSNFVHTIAL